MFIGVYEKLERAGYFFNNLKTLAEEVGGFPFINKSQEMRANLDGFFFEIISAKDFFLQGINDKYGRLLPRNKCTNQLGALLTRLTSIDPRAYNVILDIQTKLSTKSNWLWELNNYRNSATHRELLHLAHEASFDIPVSADILDKVKKSQLKIKPIFGNEGTGIQLGVPVIKILPENIKTYLFKDPEDPTQGNATIEVLAYCEKSLGQMRQYLDNLFSQL